MFMSKRQRVFSLIVALVLLATAIGTRPIRAAGPGGSITVWCVGFDPHVNGWTKVIEGYKKVNPDATVTLEPQGGQADMLAKYKASLASGTGADIFTTPGWDVYEFSIAGQLLPLSPKVMSYADAKAKLFPEYILQSQVDNQLWAIGIPDPPGDSGIIVNLDALDAAGLTKIGKFDSRSQLLDYAKKLTTFSGGSMKTAGLSFQENNGGTYFLSYIVDQGGKFWDNDKQAFDFNTPEATTAMQFFLDLYEKDKVDAIGMPNAIDGMLQGTVNMAFLWPEFMPFASGAAPDKKFGFIMKPSFTGKGAAAFSHADTWNAIIPKYTKNPDLAYDFMRYLASEEGQLLFLDANPGLSPLRSLVLNNDYYKTGKGAYLAPVIDAMKTGGFQYYGPWLDGSTIQYDILWTNIEDMINKKVTIQQGLANLTSQANEQIAKSRARIPNAPKTIIYSGGLPDDLKIK
jgi:multiple sugar transport system substrate-binding protein